MSKAKDFNRRLTKGRKPDLPKLPGTERINALISVCKTNWFLLMSYLAFIGVTLIGVVDMDFFLPERRTELPLIGVTIPTSLCLLYRADPWGDALCASALLSNEVMADSGNR